MKNMDYSKFSLVFKMCFRHPWARGRTAGQNQYRRRAEPVQERGRTGQRLGLIYSPNIVSFIDVKLKHETGSD